MTVKEKLRERIDALTEEEAHEALLLLDLRDAPVDDEPLTEDEQVAAAEGRADIAAGRTVALSQLAKSSSERRALARRARSERAARLTPAGSSDPQPSRRRVPHLGAVVGPEATRLSRRTT